MSRRAHRRLRLPADDRTPAVARAAVRQVLLDGGRADQLDEALLLVSELSTNGVVHAGTPVDVDVLADETGVTITVSDQKTGLVGAPAGARNGPFDLIAAPAPPELANGARNGHADPRFDGRADLVAVPDPAWDDDTDELEERGRGLLLVDRLASAWGTSHYASGKSVWFRLGCVAGEEEPIRAPLQALRRPEAPDGPPEWALPPRPLPAAPGVDFGAVHVAGTGDGSGFYDVLPVRRNRWFVSIGDVGGQGPQAAVLTGVVRDVMRALMSEDLPTSRMLASLHRTLLADAEPRHATVAAAMVTRLEPRGRARVLDVALRLAGSGRPLLVRADGTTSTVGDAGCALGLVEQFEAPETVLALDPGDALVFADGIPERRDRSRSYGFDRLSDLLPGLSGRSAQAMADRIREDVLTSAAGSPRNDFAVLVLRNPA